jgi:polysaccharide chain length determinant protein (PEP-CTERM system associated)
MGLLTDQLERVWGEVRASNRFRWPAIAVVWVLCLLGWFFVLTIPDRYETRAQVYVNSASILKPLLQGIAVSTDTQNAADVVRRALLSRPNLERVAAKTNLLARAKAPDQVEQIYLQLAKDITISGDQNLNVYTVLYQDQSPQMARAVVQALIDTFVENSVGQGREDTASAQRFLRQQVSEYEIRLSASEERLAEFKKRYIGLMPDQRGDYFNRMQTEMAALEKLKTDVTVATRQRDELRRKLTGDTGSEALPPMPTDRQIQTATEIDAQLQTSRRQLEDLLIKFTDKHPDVIALRDTIARLEERRREELGRVRATSPGVSSNGQPGVDTVLQNLQIQLNVADVQVVTAATQLAESQRRVADLQRMLTAGPEVEAELARLNRDYGVTKAQYEALLQRLESARISDRADKSEEVRFKVLEPPRVPVKPVSPLRGAMVLIVLLFGVAGGAIVAYGLNLLQPVFVTGRALTEATGVALIGIVSHYADPRLKRTGGRFGMIALCGLLCTLFLGLAVFNHPASVLLRTSLGLE